MKGCLFIHGFTGSPLELNPLVSYIQSQHDWLIRAPLLPGHGEEQALDRVTWQEWVDTAERELQELQRECEEVYLVGFSMGGIIASYLAAKYPVHKVVLLSAAVFYLNPVQFLRELKELVVSTIKSGGSLSQSLQRYKRKIKSTPLRAVYHFRQLVKHLTPYISQIKAPILIVHGKKDDIVKPKSAYYIYENVQSEEKELLLLDQSKHIVCHDCEQHIVFERIHEFFCKQTVWQ